MLNQRFVTAVSTEPSRQVQTVFTQDLDVPPSERDMFLNEHYEDERRGAEVASLLDAKEEASSFFDELRASVPAPTIGASQETLKARQSVLPLRTMSSRCAPAELTAKVRAVWRSRYESIETSNQSASLR
jgi:hypothetical protein